MSGQQGDVYLFQTPNNGDIEIEDGIVTTVGGLATAVYLSILGGNEDDDGLEQNLLTWWGNVDETEQDRKYISETQNLLRGLPAVSRNLILVEEAVKRDLKWMLDNKVASNIDVFASIPEVGRISIDVGIIAEGNRETFNFTENWQADYEGVGFQRVESSPSVIIPPNPQVQELQLLVDTTIAGDTASDTIRIPMVGTGDVDWGDGTQTLGATGVTDHTYSSGGQYTVSIQNTITSINYSNSNDKDKLLEISNWGTMSWATMNSSFFGCSNMEITASDLPNLSGVTDMYATFNGCSGLTSLPLIDTSNVTDMTYTFGGSGLTSFPVLDTSNVTTFLGTFWSCSGLTSFPVLDFSSATTLESCWRFCTGLTSFPLISIPNVTTLKYAWYNCSSLNSFPLIDTSSVTYLLGAWQGCSSLTSFPLIDTSSVTYMRNAWLGCSGLTSFPLIDTSSAGDINSTWSNCTSLTSFPTLNFSSMTNGSGMFSGVTLDTTSWSDLLIATEANNNNNSVSWSGGNSQYNASGQTARALLTGAPRNWSITDGGLA